MECEGERTTRMKIYQCKGTTGVRHICISVYLSLFLSLSLSLPTLKSVPRIRFIFREWMRRIPWRPISLGLGNSIFRSMRPGRRRAGSRVSIRLVAVITY